MKSNKECLIYFDKKLSKTAFRPGEVQLADPKLNRFEMNPIGRRKTPRTGSKCYYSSYQSKNHQLANELLSLSR